MSVLPIISFAFGVLAVAMYYGGLAEASMIPMVAGVLAGAGSVLMGDKESPVGSRVSGAIGIVFCMMPVIIPLVKDFRLQQLAAQRAAQTRPQYERLESAVAEITPKINDYFAAQGYFPDIRGNEYLPFVGRDGRLQAAVPMAGLAAPVDPFSPGNRPLRWAAIRDRGVVLVSVGQSGVAEYPLPPIMMDGPPASPLAGFAMTGTDPRHRTYDPTNGGLSLGDVVHYAGRATYAEAMAPLFEAWDLVHARAPWTPPTQRPRQARAQTGVQHDSQAARDAREAMRLLEERRYLAALALGSRSMRERARHEAQWTDAERQLGYIRGMALYNLAAYREAADAFLEFVDLHPNDPVGHFYLGACLHIGQRPQDALIHLAAAAQIAPGHNITAVATQCYEAALAGRQPPFPPAAGVRE